MPDLATACVWDNNDANVKTLDGKETGHTYQNVLKTDEVITCCPLMCRKSKNRHSFVGSEHPIAPFRKPISNAQLICSKSTAITSTTTTSDEGSTEDTTISSRECTIDLKVLGLYWFCRLRDGNTPLYAGFMSQYIKDPLPIQHICYMDPISKSSTNNDVARVISTVPSDPSLVEEYLSNDVVTHHLKMYEDYFQSTLEENLGLQLSSVLSTSF